MRKLLLRLSVGSATFLLGVAVTPYRLCGPCPTPSREPAAQSAPAAPPAAAPERPSCTNVVSIRELPFSPEEKAVLMAEDFVRRNGYTSSPGVVEGLTLESLEWSDRPEEILRSRRDTLEPTAYGVWRSGLRHANGWTVVFRHTERFRGRERETGRAVTMDGDLQNLRVEHQDFFLDMAGKKLK